MQAPPPPRAAKAHAYAASEQASTEAQRLRLAQQERQRRLVVAAHTFPPLTLGQKRSKLLSLGREIAVLEQVYAQLSQELDALPNC